MRFDEMARRVPGRRGEFYDIGTDYESKVATIYVVFCFTIFNIQIFTPIIPALLFAVTGLYSYFFHKHLLVFVHHNRVTLLFPLIVLLSAFYSDVPTISLYYGLQLCMTVGIGILLGVCSTPRQLIRGVFIATVLVTIASIASGRTGPSAVGPVLIGLTGSKDQMGFVGLTLAASGVAVMFDPRQHPYYRAAAVLFAPVGAYIAAHVDSAAPMLAVVGFVCSFLGFFSLRYFSQMNRWGLVVFGLAVIFPVAVVSFAAMFNFDAGGAVLQALNKDATLTGRTVLWSVADDLIDKAPIFGHGYRSFWLGNSADSVQLLSKFGLSDGRLFQFHQTFREILVDTGWMGLIAFGCAAVVFLFYVLGNVLLYPTPTSAFIASMYLLFLVRTPIESIVVIFSPHTALFYACGTSAVVSFMNRARSRMQRDLGAVALQPRT